jgi:predicted neuraminidase
MGYTVLAREPLLPSDHRLFESCHASTLVRTPGGELLAAFFAGSREGEGDVAIWVARRTPSGWLPPVRTFAEEGVAHWNPVLHAEGERVWIFYKVGPSVHSWVTRWAASTDAGRTWSSPRELVAGEKAPRGPVKNKLIVTSSGEWLAPGSVETEEAWDAFVDISADTGRTWRRFDVPLEHRRGSEAGSEVWKGLAANALWESDASRVFRWDGVIQPTLWESAPGRVHMLLRSTRGVAYRSDSVDHGRTWRPAHPTDIPNNNSGLDLVRLEDGRLLLVSNPVSGNWGRRYPLSVDASDDNGTTWCRMLDLETEEGEFSYPAVIAESRLLHLTYTWNRQNVVYQCVEVKS